MESRNTLGHEHELDLFFMFIFVSKSRSTLVREETKRFSDSGALARAAKHHGEENLVIHASEKFW